MATQKDKEKEHQPKEVLLDTNFLLEPARSKVDIFTALKEMGYQPVVLTCVVDELARLSIEKGKKGVESKVGLALMARHPPKIVRADKPVDSALFRYAKEHAVAVATNDRNLIKRLKALHIRIIRLRQRKMLVEE